MSFGGGATVAAARVVLGVDAGQFSEGLRSAEAQWGAAMGEMGGATAELAERQLRAAAAAERLDMAIKQGAAGTVRATEATAALVREQRKLVDVQLEADAASTKFGRGMRTNSAHASNYGRALGITTTALVGGAGLVYGIKLAIDASQKFQQQMILIQTQALKSRGEVDRMTKAVLHLSGPLATSPTDLSKGLYHVESAGYSAAKAVQVMTTATKGARIGQSDLEQTTNALVAALRTGIRGTSDMHMAMSTLDAIVGAGNMRMDDLANALSSGVVPAAKQFGLSLADLGGALDTLTIKGVPAELAATRLRYTIALLGASTPKAAKQLESIGIADGKVAKIMRTQGLVPALELLDQKLKTSGKSIEGQNAILVRAYGGGRSSTTILTLLQNLRELQHRTEIIEKQGTASKFSARWVEQTRTAAFAFDQLRAIVSKTAIELGDALLPGAVKSAQAISTWLDKASNQHRLQSDLRHGFNDVSEAATEFGHVLHGIADAFRLVDEAVPGNLLKLLLEGFLLFKAAKIAQGFTTAFVDPMKAMVTQTKTAQKELGALEAMAARPGGGNLPGSVLPMKALRPDVAGGAPLATESAAFDKVAVAVGRQAVALRTLDGVIDDQGGFLDSQVAATRTTVEDTAAREANVAAVKDQIAAYDRFMTQFAARTAYQEEEFARNTVVGTRGPGGVLVRGAGRGATTPLYSASAAGQGQFGNPFALNVSQAARDQVTQVAPTMPLPMAFALTPAQTQEIADRWNPVYQRGYRTKEKPSMTSGDVRELQSRLSGMSPAAQQSIIGALSSGEEWTIGDLDGMSSRDLEQLARINPDIAQAVRLQRIRDASGRVTSTRVGSNSAYGGPGLTPGPISDQYTRAPGTSFGGDRYFRRMPDGSLVRVGAEEYFGRYSRSNVRAAAPTAEERAAQVSGLEQARAANQEQIQAHEAALTAARQRLSSARGVVSSMPVPAPPPVSPAEMAALEQASGQALNARQRFDEELTRRYVHDDLSNMRPEEAATRRRLQRAVAAEGWLLSDAQTRNYMARQEAAPYGAAQSNMEQAQAEVQRRQALLEAARQEGVRLAQAQARTLGQTPVEQRPYTSTPIQEPFPGYQYPQGAAAGYSGRTPMAAGGVAEGRLRPGYEYVSGVGGATMQMPVGSGYPRQFQGEPSAAERAALRDEAAAARQNLENAQARAAEMRRQADAARAQQREAENMAAQARQGMAPYAQAITSNKARAEAMAPLQEQLRAATYQAGQAVQGRFVEGPTGLVPARLAGTTQMIPMLPNEEGKLVRVDERTATRYLLRQRRQARTSLREFVSANPELSSTFPQGIVGQTQAAQANAAAAAKVTAETEAQARAAAEAVKPVEEIAAAWQGVIERIGGAGAQVDVLAARMKVLAGVNLARAEAAAIPVGAAQGKIASTPGDVLAGLQGSGRTAGTGAAALPAVALSKEAKQAILDRAGYVGNTRTYTDGYTKMAQAAGLAQRPLQGLVEAEVALGRETQISMQYLDGETAAMKRLGLAATADSSLGATKPYRGPQAVVDTYQGMGKRSPLVTGLNWDQLVVAQREYQTQIAAITTETGLIVEGLGVTEEDLVKLRSELTAINADIARVEAGLAAEARATSMQILPNGQMVPRSSAAFFGAKRGIGPGGVTSVDAAAMAAEEKTMMASSAAMLASMRQQMQTMRLSIAQSSVMQRMGGMGRGMGMNQAMGLGMLMTMFGGQLPGVGGMLSGGGMGMMLAPMLSKSAMAPYAGFLLGGAVGARSLVREHVHGTGGDFAGNIAGGAMAGAGAGLMFAPESLGLSVLAGAGIGAAVTGLSMLFHSSDSTAKALMKLGVAAHRAERGVSSGRMLLQQARGATANDKYNLDQSKSAWEAAKAEEKATRGTRDHHVAVDKLNASYQNYMQSKRLVTADEKAEVRAQNQILNGRHDLAAANRKLVRGIADVAHSIKTETHQWAYGTTQADKAAFRVKAFADRMTDLAEKAQKTNPKLAATYRRLADVTKETNKIPTDPKYIKLVMKVGWEGTKEAKLTLALISGQLGKQFPLIFGKGGPLGKGGFLANATVHYDAKTGMWVDSEGHPIPNQRAAWQEWGKKHGFASQPPGGATEPMPAGGHHHHHGGGGGGGGPHYVDPQSSTYLMHRESEIAQIQAGLKKGNVRKLQEEELRWLRTDYKRARTDAQRQAIAEEISALKSQMERERKHKHAHTGSLIPQALQDQYNRAFQHHNKKAELVALEKERKYLQHVAAHSKGERHHDAEQELNAVTRRIAALQHTSASSAGFLSGKEAKEWVKLQNRFAKAEQTTSPKDDIAALRAEQKFLQRVRDHLHGKAELEANKLLAQIDKKLQKLVELQTETLKDLERTYLSDLASFFASFGSNVFTGDQGGRSPGSQGPGSTQGGAPGTGSPPGPERGPPGTYATGRNDSGTTLVVNQHFPPGTEDAADRHAIYARTAMQSQFD